MARVQNIAIPFGSYSEPTERSRVVSVGQSTRALLCVYAYATQHWAKPMRVHLAALGWWTIEAKVIDY